MQDYNFINGLSGSFLQPETRRFLAAQKVALTVELHREQAKREREQSARELRCKKLVQNWGFDPLELEFLSNDTLEYILYKAETLYEYE